MTVAEIIAQIEAYIALNDEDWQMDNDDFLILIASHKALIDALEEIAKQKLCIEDRQLAEHADWQTRYEECVKCARAAFKATGEK